MNDTTTGATTDTPAADTSTGPGERSQRLALLLSASNGYDTEAENTLRARIVERREDLEALNTHIRSEWIGEDLVYRFWHHSFKVYALQDTTTSIAAALESLAPPGRPLDPWFQRLIAEGTGRTFTPEVNSRWFEETKPIVDAFFHARHLLEMVLAHVDDPPSTFITSGWATVLTLYGMR